MAEWEDVRRIAMGLPSVVESTKGDGTLEWRVKDKLFAWERPLRKADLGPGRRRRCERGLRGR
jgi:hypothetical protein